jgi:hypothetical protein
MKDDCDLYDRMLSDAILDIDRFVAWLARRLRALFSVHVWGAWLPRSQTAKVGTVPSAPAQKAAPKLHI